MSSQCSFRYGRNCSTVIPSMPGAPPFVSTRVKAVSRLPRSHIRSHTFSPAPLDAPLLSAANGSTLWLSLEGFTFSRLPAVTPAGVFCFPCSFVELFKFRPPCRSALPTLTDVVLWRRLTPAASNQSLDWGCDFFFAWRQVSPDKNVDLLRALAQFTALPFDGLDFMILCPLVRARRLISGLCSSKPVLSVVEASRICLGLPSDLASRQRPCLWLTVSAINPRKGLAPSSQRPCWAYIKSLPQPRQAFVNPR